MSAHREFSCQTANTVNTDIRTAANNGRSPQARSRSKKIPLGRARYTCREPTRFLAAPSAALCCLREPSQPASARSAVSNFTPAGSARISILPADSSAASPFPSASLVKMNATTVRSIPCASVWRKKLRLPAPLGLMTRAKRLRIFSRNNAAWYRPAK
jgi:hypothetical protein